jgi:hypothetical protein
MRREREAAPEPPWSLTWRTGAQPKRFTMSEGSRS